MKNELTAKRLRAALSSANMSQQELADKSGVNKASISQYVNGSHAPSNVSSGRMAEVLNVNPMWLMGFDVCSEKKKDCNQIEGIDFSFSKRELAHIKNYHLLDDFGRDSVDMVTSREMERVKQLREKEDIISSMEISEELIPGRIYTYFGRIACAGIGFYFDEIPTETIEAPDMGGDFIIGVNGDSMEPDYHDGDMLYVKKTEHISHGDVGIFTVGNECFLKEYGEDGLISHNRDYEDIPGTEDIRLIGKVIGKVEMEN